MQPKQPSCKDKGKGKGKGKGLGKGKLVQSNRPIADRFSSQFDPNHSKDFKGLSGSAQTTGVRSFPFSIVTLEGRRLPGILDSHEIPGSAPLLLSIHAQVDTYFSPHPPPPGDR